MTKLKCPAESSQIHSSGSSSGCIRSHMEGRSWPVVVVVVVDDDDDTCLASTAAASSAAAAAAAVDVEEEEDLWSIVSF